VIPGFLFLAFMAVSCDQDVGPEEVFREYLDAVNQNDVSRALAVQTRDAEFVIPGQTPVRGIDGIRSLLQWDSVLQSQVRFGVVERIGDTLIAGPGSERSLWFEGIGLDSLAYEEGTRVVFEGRLIKGIYPAALIPESAAAFELRFGEFMAWATQNAPDELDQLMPGGFFEYSSAAAEGWLTLLRRYEAARGLETQGTIRPHPE